MDNYQHLRYDHFDDYYTFLEQLDNNTKGKYFEYFARDFLIVHPDYNYDINTVCFCRDASFDYWSQIKMDRPSGGDIGTDLFIKHNDGSISIVQVKCYSKETMTINNLGTFWFTKLVTKNNVRDYYVFTTCKYISKNLLQHNPNVKYIMRDKITEFINLFQWIKNYHQNQFLPTYKYTLKSHQIECVDKVIAEFNTNNKAQITLMCGTGKTFVSIEVAIKLNAKQIVIFVPTILLASQTMLEWFRYFKRDDIDFLIVSSDTDPLNYCYTTTDIQQITDFMDSSKTYKIVISTYHSSPLLQKYLFDLAIFDEAHHTVKNRDKERYKIVDSPIIKHKLFMTATQKVDNSLICRSMNNYDDYGNIVYTYPLGRAIKDNILNNYKIVIGTANESIQKINYDGDIIPSTYGLCAYMIKEAFLNGRFKILTYHNSIKNAETMVKFLSNYLPTQGIDVFISTLTSKMNGKKRREILTQFEHANYSILCTVAVFKEGINIPSIDAVCFCDPKHSKIDIIQSIGRCLRKAVGKLDSLILLPYNESENDPFSVIKEILLTLAHEDSSIIDEILYQTNSKINFANYSPDHPKILDKLILEFTQLLNKIRLTIFDSKFTQYSTLDDYLSAREYELFIFYCDHYQQIPISKQGNKKVIANYVNDVKINHGYDLALIQEILIINFPFLTTDQQDKLWSYPDWYLYSNRIGEEYGWYFIYNKVVEFINQHQKIPFDNQNPFQKRLILWLNQQKTDRFPLSVEQISHLDRFIDYGFKWASFSSNLSLWQQATYDACFRQYTKYGSPIKINLLLTEELTTIVNNTKSKGKTPDKTLSATLKKLIHMGFLNYNDTGLYTMKMLPSYTY